MRYRVAIGVTVLIITASLGLSGQTLAAGGTTATGNSPLIVRHVIGLDKVSSQKSGRLSVQNGAMQFDAGKAPVTVPATSIDAIFVGTETTQAGGKVGRGVKTAAIAAPYGTGKVLSLLMRTKVDILTVSYRDPTGALHAAIFALPIGQAIGMRTQLIAAGAHESASKEGSQ
ncbi:MAG TPA: hypothetical protein VH157_12830 [Bryobacteraceae bacterium]|nr:hypothetical protein [Bryobacteraceae bacterium]